MKKNELTISKLFDLSHSMAGEQMKNFEYPWEVLSHIEEWILEIGKNLPEEEYEKKVNTSGSIKQQPLRQQHLLHRLQLLVQVQKSVIVHLFAEKHWLVKAL